MILLTHFPPLRNLARRCTDGEWRNPWRQHPAAQHEPVELLANLPGKFEDYLFTCLFEMYDLTDQVHLREIVMNMKLGHKEILFFLGIRLYPTQKLADLRGQIAI